MKINLISEWGNVVSNVRNNIVFENRNQAYGAYFIRREYPRTVFFALFVTTTILAFGALSLKLSQYFSKNIIPVEIPIINSPIEIITPVDLKPIEIPPAKTEPMKSTPPPKGTEFMAPIITDDKDSIEDKQPTQTELKPGKVDGVETNDSIDIPEVPKKSGTGIVTFKEDTILDFVDINPMFPGGIEKMYEFITEKTKYPQAEKENGITGTVYIGFVVDKSGKIKDVTIERGVANGSNLNKEAQRVIGMMPDWKPGVCKGQTVSVRYHIPVKFMLR